MLPDGRCDIILRYNERRPDDLVLCVTGPATQAYTVHYEAGDIWIGLRLRPHNAALIWHENIAQAANRVLRGPDALALVPGLAKIDPQQMTAAHFADVLGTLPGPKHSMGVEMRLHRALDVLHASGGRMRMENLAAILKCSARHLSRMFQSNIGLSPKTYAQLVQFHRTLKLINQHQLSISAAAHEGGYSDHTHLARTFRRFGGFSPSDIPADLSLPALFV